MIYTSSHKIDFSALSPDIAYKIRNSARYIVDSDLVEVIRRENMFACIKALMEAEIMHLPFSPMFIEFDLTDIGRWMVLVEEPIKDGDGKFTCQVFYLHRKTDTVLYAAKDVKVWPSGSQMASSSSGKQEYGLAATVAVSMGLLLLNIRGVNKNYVEAPEKLNKQRRNKRLEPIHSATVLHISTVYDRDGKSVNYGSGMKKPHLRVAYTRRQHYGEGFSKTKLVYIPGVLVNFKPGTDPSTILPTVKHVRY